MNRNAKITLTTMGLLCAALVPTVAHADIFSDLGLTGGENLAAIQKVTTKGSIVFDKKSKSVVSVDHPSTEAAVHCGRSGYRATKLGTLLFPGNKVNEQGTTDAVFRFSTAASEIEKACGAGKTTVSLDIAVVARCSKVKTAIGKSHYTPVGATKSTYDLTCK
ncbi:MAG: hypothetical protein R3B70_47230 [Polyangiaceae bacterium]